MIKVHAGPYTIWVSVGTPRWRVFKKEDATMVESWAGGTSDPEFRYELEIVVTREPQASPVLSVEHVGHLGRGIPTMLCIPETDVLFICSEEHIATFDLLNKRVIERRELPIPGAHRFEHLGDFVVALTVVELAIWTSRGERVWETFADPPHDYTVQNGVITLMDCMGTRRFVLATGECLSHDKTATYKLPS